jgi:hypothetical protein
VNKGRKTQGIALISVLFIAAVVLILASTFIFTVVRERQSTNAARLVSDSLQMADATSERGRLQVVGHFQDSYITAQRYVKAASDLLKGSSPADPVAGLEPFVKTATAVTIGDKKGWWKIVGTNDFDSKGKPVGDLYIDVAASAQTANGVQTVIRRIDMGQSQVFDLAMLSEDTSCMYCHLKVNGDVGSLGATLRPGYGTEGVNGINSGAFSQVNGNVYTTGKLTGDATDITQNPKKINGTLVTGEVEVESNSQKLPRDDDDNIAFPPIKRKTAKEGARGSIKSAANIYTIPEGGSLTGYSPTGGNATSLQGSNDGNVVLIGTKDKPIVLEGDLYFDGDVVIKGYVKGQGAIYSGRNVYVAGNLTYIDPPPNCATKTDPDGCAQQAIRDKKDELRLGARGNVVMGDYTEQDINGNTKPWQGLQAADYFREEFFTKDPNSSAQTCYDKATGDELDVLTKTTAAGTTTALFNIEGEKIANSTSDNNVVCVFDKAKTQGSRDAYDYSMRPGQIQTDGSFKNWLSDALYQEILGKEVRGFDTWRYDVEGSLTEDEVRRQFDGYDLSDETIKKLASKTGTFELKNSKGDIVGRAEWRWNKTIRVIMDPPREYATQTTRVDAFVYSNQRIAAKTFNAPFVVNGGLVAKELGILAPGIIRRDYMDEEESSLKSDRYDFMGDVVDRNTNTNPQLDCSDEKFIAKFLPKKGKNDPEPINNAQLLQPDSIDCSLTINYDHRLRNGGLGYNLVTPDIGRTLNWQISDKRADRVGVQ